MYAPGRLFSILCLCLLCFASAAASQADCPALVDAAFNATNELCADLGRNEACYGNLLLSATPREDVAAFAFEQAGDRVPVADIQSLQLSAMSLTDETWGVALMLLQANLPDTLPGQNVTVVLFGDVRISNAVGIISEFEVTATANVNVRLRPTTSQNNVIASLSNGQTLIANGRLADGTWVRVVLDAETQQVGWVSADYLSSETDLSRLSVVEVDSETVYAPMQAFYFASSIGDSQCDEAPSSGILIQTPQGAGSVNLRVNEVDITLGSTVFLQTGNGVMRVSVVEGHAVLSSDGVSQTVLAGTYAEIPLDGNGLANGAPTFPQPYAMADVRALPVNVALPQSVSITLPVEDDEDAIQAAIDIADGLPVGGQWVFTYTVTEDTNCVAPGEPNSEPLGYVHPGAYVTFTFSDDRQVLHFYGYGYSDLMLLNISEDTYQYSDGMWTLTIEFTGSTTFDIYEQFAYPAPQGCIHNWNGTGSFEG